jgi:hypothetical protein
MPLEWYKLNLEEQAEEIVDMIDGLTDEDIAAGYDEWATRRYERSILGETEALSDFQQILTKNLLKRLGRWESYVDTVTTRKEI